MKAPSLVLIIFLVCMIFVMVGLVVVSAHNQRVSSRSMEGVIAGLTERSRDLEREVKNLQQQLARPEDRAHREVAPQSTPDANTNSSTNQEPPNPVQPRPFQARAYVGNDFLGTAWVIPSNVKQDSESGEFRFEPIIWIDEKSRAAFTRTNIVERDVVRNNTYNQTWSYSQPYWYGYPVWIKPQHHHKNDSPNVPPPQRPPVAQPLPGSGGAWSTVTGGRTRSIKPSSPPITDSLGGSQFYTEPSHH